MGDRTCPQRQAQAVARHGDWVERHAQAVAGHADWVLNGGPERKAKRLARQCQDDSDTKSNLSESTVSTSASTTQPFALVLTKQLVLTEQETREARKYQKALRDIAKIEEQLARGEEVDVTQVEKIHRRSEIEGTIVMAKVRAGYTFRA